MTSIQKQFGEKLRKIRIANGLTQESLAGKAGLHFTYVGQAERGVRNVTLDTLCKLAKALKVKGGDLLPF
ncbi:MAG TPA: helix-turn-helix transcriptional regulator [Nevskiaceae bacterium]|nr:helix-turn-helix transcriptional regulator [Nevskiaceae bacterium]